MQWCTKSSVSITFSSWPYLKYHWLKPCVIKLFLRRNAWQMMESVSPCHCFQYKLAVCKYIIEFNCCCFLIEYFIDFVMSPHVIMIYHPSRLIQSSSCKPSLWIQNIILYSYFSLLFKINKLFLLPCFAASSHILSLEMTSCCLLFLPIIYKPVLGQ